MKVLCCPFLWIINVTALQGYWLLSSLGIFDSISQDYERWSTGSRCSDHFQRENQFLFGGHKNANESWQQSCIVYFCCFWHRGLFCLLCALNLDKKSTLCLCTLESMTVLWWVRWEWRGRSSMGSWVISWRLLRNDYTRVIPPCCEEKNQRNKSFPKVIHTDFILGFNFS